jgi:hypothetical protein
VLNHKKPNPAPMSAAQTTNISLAAGMNGKNHRAFLDGDFNFSINCPSLYQNPMSVLSKWDERYLALAKEVATWSKDSAFIPNNLNHNRECFSNKNTPHNKQ